MSNSAFTVTGTTIGGSVSSVGTGTGLTGGPITTSGTISLTVPVVVSSGGTGLTTAGANGVFVSNNSSIPSWLANGTTGQVLTATTGAAPSWGSNVASITGTSNRITVTPTTGNAVVDIAATYTGQTSIITVGTIGTGTWNGTAIDASHGGTGATSLTSHGVLVGNGTGAVSAIGPTATVGQVLQSAGSSADPAFSTATYPLTTTANQLLYSSATNTVGGLSSANNGVLITSAGGVPSYLAAGTTGQVLIATTGSPASWGALSSAAVTSITGTANQITASASTGAVTLSLPSAVITPGTLAVNGLTAGSVLFSGASSVVTQDNANLFWDDSNNRLGVGTNAPLSKLDVSGGAAIGSYAATSAAPSNSVIISGSLGVGTATPTASSSATKLAFAGDCVFSPFTEDSQMILTGATNPGLKMFFGFDTTNKFGFLYANEAFVGGKPFLISTPTNGVAIGSGGTKPVSQLDVFGNMSLGSYAGSAAAPTNGMIVSGQVGIGTSSPVCDLEVKGASTIPSNELGSFVVSGVQGSGGIPRLILGINYSGSAMNYGYFQALENGVLGRPLAIQPIGGAVGVATVAPLSKMDINGNLAIGSYAATVAAPTNGLIVSGRVGVGTNAPAYPFQASSASTGPQIVASFQNGDTGGSTSEARFVFMQGGGFYQGIGGKYNSASPYLSFSVSSSIDTWAEKMIITSSGIVAIGTLAPDTSAKLQADSTTQGFLPPRMTTTEKNAISSPAEGLVVYDITLHKLCVRGASAWETITSV